MNTRFAVLSHTSRLQGFQLATQTAFILQGWPQSSSGHSWKEKWSPFLLIFTMCTWTAVLIWEEKHLLLQLLSSITEKLSSGC